MPHDDRRRPHPAHHATTSRRRRALPAAALSVLALSAAGLTTVAGQAPVDAATTTPLVSTTALPTAQINGVGWNQVASSSRVFVGGSFSKARPAGAAPGTREVTRSNLMSYNLTTGVMDSFAPAVNGEVKNLALSPDKKTLYIVGTFTKVGTATRNRIAAFDVATGKLTSFAPNLNSSAYGVLPTAKGIYVGGAFSSANGVTRYRTAAFTTAGALTTWVPNVQGGDVRDLVMTPDTTGLVLGGNFTSVNGSSKGFGLALVGYRVGNKLYSMGVNNVVRNGASVGSGIYDLAADSGGFYGAGWGNSPTLEGAFRADWKGALTWVEDCHGDTYSIWPSGTNVYTASHAHYCANSGGFGEPDPMIHQRGMAFTTDARGTVQADPTHYKNWAGTPRPKIQQFYPDIDPGTYTKLSQGAWSVTGSGNYILYAGEFTTVNGRAQQGLVRFATRTVTKSTDGPLLPSGYKPAVTGYAGGVARVRWPSVADRDNTGLTYELIKNGNTAAPIAKLSGPGYFWIQPSLGAFDTGLVSGKTTTYQVRVTDSDGNVRVSSTTAFTYNSGTALANYNKAVLTDNPDSYWTVGADGTTTDLAAGQASVGAPAGTSAGVLGGTSQSFDFTGAQSISTSTRQLAPTTFSVEAWFRTTSTIGGAIVSSGTKQTGDSPLTLSNTDQARADRTIYLGPDGKINFGLWNRTATVLSSTKAYNDGQWHHVVGTMDHSGTKLFIDGASVAAQSAVYNATNKSGYWRIGGDLITGYPDNPGKPATASTGYFTGDIDQVSIYQRALSAAQVAAHYKAKTG